MAKFKHLLLWCSYGVVAAIALVMLSRVFAPGRFQLSLGLPIILYLLLARVVAQERRLSYWFLAIVFCVGSGLLSGELLTQSSRELNAVAILQISTIGAVNGAILFLFFNKARRTKNKKQT